ncbi:MAG: DUF2142 domain-containing protein [Clostridia bacterium]|nr:DUF2142 domain-containing protein [Clostridia bacterium]
MGIIGLLCFFAWGFFTRIPVFNREENVKLLSNVFLVLAELMLFTFLAVLYMCWCKVKLEYIFLVCALCLGVAHTFIVVPFGTCDEIDHFSTAYHYSNKLLGVGPTKSGKTIYMREDDMAFYEKTEKSVNIYHPERDGLAKYYRIMGTELFSLKTSNKLVEFGGTKINGPVVKMTPTVYVPQALGITAARLLNLGGCPTYYLGRLCNLITYAVLVFFAIRFMPFGKKMLTVAAMLPIMIHQSASYSYDVSVVSFAFLFFAYSLKMAFGPGKVRWKNVIVLCALAALLAPAKVVYCFICLTCFLIPKEKFSELNLARYKKAIPIALVLITAFLSFGVFASAVVGRIIDPSYTQPLAEARPVTLGYLLRNMQVIPMIIFNSIITEGYKYLEDMLCANLGWLNLPINPLLIYSVFTILLMSAIKHRGEHQLNGKNKLLLFGIAAVTMILVCASMLFGWTMIPKTDQAFADFRIRGVQGRYFLPMLPVLLILFQSRAISWKKNIDRALTVAILTVNIFVIGNMYGHMIGVLRQILTDTPQ